LLAAALALSRLARGRTRRPPLQASAPNPASGISVIVPARDEAERIGPCLAGLAEDPDVAETIVVVDADDPSPTAAVAATGGARVVVTPPLPAGWVGKPWALQHGLEAARGEIFVTLDADTRPRPGLVAALARELDGGAGLVTAGTRFVCETFGERLLHPAMLATLVYRFGPAGADSGSGRAHRAMANGQCQAFRREELVRAGGFTRTPGRMTDDIALARSLAADGWRIHFLDGADLISVRMHASMREVWREWGRSLSMQDVTPRRWQALDLLVLWLAVALPLVRTLARRANPVDLALIGVRFALLFPLRRVYERRGAAFWLSPFADVIAALRLTLSTVRPIRTWRGRTYPVTPVSEAHLARRDRAPDILRVDDGGA
jgi:dolichol-phosphate mannosyltransferase